MVTASGMSMSILYKPKVFRQILIPLKLKTELNLLTVSRRKTEKHLFCPQLGWPYILPQTVWIRAAFLMSVRIVLDGQSPRSHWPLTMPHLWDWGSGMWTSQPSSSSAWSTSSSSSLSFAPSSIYCQPYCWLHICRWIQLDSEYHPLDLQSLLNLPVKINTQMGSNPFVFSV